MPDSLAAVKVSPAEFDRIAEQAMQTPWVPHNPRPIETTAQLREILQLAA
jgi:maleylacetate reductase